MKTSRAEIRVRYADTDRMGRVYYARFFEWLECGRSQYMRDAGLPYSEMEAAGVFLPVLEAHCRYRKSPAYDEVVVVETSLEQPVRARAMFRYTITAMETGAPIADGWTSHPFVNANGRPMRPPRWVLESLMKGR